MFSVRLCVTDTQDNYLDAYVSVLHDADPLNTSLVFNCGMGVVRSEQSVSPLRTRLTPATFGMIAALLLRRKQFLQKGLDDPFSVAIGGSGFQTVSTIAVLISSKPAGAGNQAAQFMEQATHQQSLNKSLLRMTGLLDKSKPGTDASD